jgi:hypothetical protein
MLEAHRTVLISRFVTAPWRPAPLASVFAFHEIQPLPQLEQAGAPAQANLADRPRGANRPNWFVFEEVIVDHQDKGFRISIVVK